MAGVAPLISILMNGSVQGLVELLIICRLHHVHRPCNVLIDTVCLAEEVNLIEALVSGKDLAGKREAASRQRQGLEGEKMFYTWEMPYCQACAALPFLH